MIMRAFYFTNLNLVASGIHKLWQSSRRGGSAQAGFTGLLWWCDMLWDTESLQWFKRVPELHGVQGWNICRLGWSERIRWVQTQIAHPLQALHWSHGSCNSDCKYWSQEDSKNYPLWNTTKNTFKQEARNTTVETYLLYTLQIFFDDSTRNIVSGKAAGFHTVIVRRVHGPDFTLTIIHVRREKTNYKTFWILQVGRSTLVPGADHALESIHNIKEALPEIWDGQDRSESDVLPPSSVGTAVVAWMLCGLSIL